MKFNRPFILSLGLLLTVFLPFVAFADFDLARWGFAREILIPADAPNSDFAIVELDQSVYQNSQYSLQDLRVIDSQNQEVAAMIVAPEAAKPPIIQAQIINHQITNRASVYTLDCGKGQNYNGIELATSSQNFSRRVQIEGSTDGVWRMLRNDGYVMDFSRDEQKRVSQISFDTSSYRYLRITIFEPRDTALDVLNIFLLPAQKNEAPYVELPAEIIGHIEDKKLRTSVLTLKLPTIKTPSSRLELLIDGTNYSRHVSLESSNDSPEKIDARWFQTGSGEVHDLALDDVKMHNQVIDYPYTRAGYLRVKISNLDDAPLKIRGVKVSVQPWYLLFKREAGKSYRLFYGNEKALAPQYDLMQLSAYVKTANLPRFKLGAETKFAASIAPEKSNRNSVFVGLAVLIAVVILSGMIYRLARASTN